MQSIMEEEPFLVPEINSFILYNFHKKLYKYVDVINYNPQLINAIKKRKKI